MEELSVIELLQLKIEREEEAYEVALKQDETNISKTIQIEETIRQLKSILQYMQEIYETH
jgi:hypothetical protein